MTAGEGMKFLAPPTGAGLYAAYGGVRVAVLDTVTFALAAGLYALLRIWAQVAPVNTVRTASRSPSEANPAWYSRSSVAPAEAARAASCASVPGPPPSPPRP